MTDVEYNLHMMKVVLELLDEAILDRNSTLEAILDKVYEHYRRQAGLLLSK